MDLLNPQRGIRGQSPSMRSDRSASPISTSEDNWKHFSLNSGEELLFSVPSTCSTGFHFRLTSGSCEFFGSEVALNKVYSFPASSRGSIFSWEGCGFDIFDEGVDTSREEKTLYPAYLNIHLALENMRNNTMDEMDSWKHGHSVQPFLKKHGLDVFSKSTQTSTVEQKPGGVAKRRRMEAAKKKIEEEEPLMLENPPPHGPRVLVLGDRDSGKSTLCKILCNYAARTSRLPLYVDTCTNEGSVSMPNTLSATVISRPIPPETPQMYTSRHIYPLVPLVYFFGYQSPEMHPALYKVLIEQLSNACRRKEWSDLEGVGTSGWIIDTPFEMSKLIDDELNPLLIHTVERMDPNVFLVIDNTNLTDALKKAYPNARVVEVSRAQGAVERSLQERKDLIDTQIRAYFYGPASVSPPPRAGRIQEKVAPVDLKAYSSDVKIGHVKVVRVGGEEGSEGEDSISIDTAIGKVDFPPLIHIQTNPILELFVLAVTSCPTLPPLPETASEQEKQARQEMLMMKIPCQPVRGFVHVSKIVEKRGVVTWLTPAPKMPHNYLMMGTLKTKANVL